MRLAVITRRSRFALGAATLAGALGAGACVAQTPQPAGSHGGCTMTDENGHTVSLPECQNVSSTPRPATPASKSAAQRFPYPGDTPNTPPPDAPAAGSPSQGAQPAADAPAVQGGASPNLPAGKRFPYPGDTPDVPPVGGSAMPGGGATTTPAGGSGPLQDAGSSGQSSSSSSPSSSRGMGDLGPDADEENPFKADDDAARARAEARRARARGAAAAPKSSADREAEDLQVADFYRNAGNFRGAYLRAKDAVDAAGDDPDAHLALAEAARKLGKLDEAQTEYRQTLKLDPTPKSRKTAERALKEMGGS